MTERNFGTGFLTQIVRTQAHILNIAAAAIHEWPLTVEQALAEAREAKQHLDSALATPLTEGAVLTIDLYKEKVDDLIGALTTGVNADPDTKVHENAEALEYAKRATEASFVLSASLDAELTGLRGNQINAGTHP